MLCANDGVVRGGMMVMASRMVGICAGERKIHPSQIHNNIYSLAIQRGDGDDHDVDDDDM